MTCLHWTIYSWQGFNWLGCPRMLSTNYRCVSVTQRQCRWRRQMCGKCCTNSHSTFTFCLVTKNDLSWLNNLFMARSQLNRMSSYAKNKLQMGSVTQYQCWCRQMCENFHKFTQYTHFLSVTTNDLSWQNNLFTARFQLIRKSSNVQNKLQMCSVTQHQWRLRQMCGKVSQIHPVHTLFVCYKKWLFLTEESIHGKVSTH